MHDPVGYELPHSTQISRPLTVPTMVIGRFRTLEEADQVIRAGDADLVGMTRGTIADPDVVRKTLEGHPEQVRPCIGCNQMCLGGLFGHQGFITCTVNAGTGYEAVRGDAMLATVKTAKKVLVIGGGPAGMEAARVAASRGHNVILAEAEPDLGGAVKMAAMAPTRHGMGDITTWLEQEIYRLGVDVRLSSYMEADEVLAEEPDAVIVATGSFPRMDGVQISNPGEPIVGMDQPHILSSHDLFRDHGRSLGQNAVVIDETGHFEAIAVAEYLQSQGLAVTYVTRHHGFAPSVEQMAMAEPALIRLSRGDFRLMTRSRVIAVDKQSVTVGPIYLPRGSNRVETVPADTVVMVSFNTANREIADALAGSGIELHLAGDAVSARHLPGAIRDGHLAGMAV
jgi:NADPH-dependent 2,4-dienoyl-CoA reductase/sulfur reductase-like enzyme